MTLAPASAWSAPSRETFWRSLQTLNATRVVVSAVLLVYLSFSDKGLHLAGEFVYGKTCIVYLLLAVLFAILTVHYRHRFLLQLLTQITIDLSVISMLYVTGGGAKSGLAILYLLPLAGSAILAPLLLALFFVSLVTLFLLAESTYQIFMIDGDAPVLQSALYGSAFFATVLVVSRLAAKLIGQEELAVRRGLDLGVQQAINRLVMAAVGDGVLVVDQAGMVYTINPAAQAMLGLAPAQGAFRLADIEALAPVVNALFAWRAVHAPNNPDLAKASAAGHADAGAVDDAVFVTVTPDDNAATAPLAAWRGRRDVLAHLKLRFARVETGDAYQNHTVVFLQDTTDIENQAHQLKLASMGRLTASLAHEVRNPLSAIGHAAALLEEDLLDATHKRLLRIVGDNVERVNQLIEDILRLSRKTHAETLTLPVFLADLLAEFRETHGLADKVVVLACATGPGAEPLTARFDPLHLRQIIVNLLTNAVRYASGGPASVRLQVVQNKARLLELHVRDDGPGISPDVRAHLFEPFYTTSSKGTGLGLYLARELCLNNAALLDYEYRYDARAKPGMSATGRFVLRFAKQTPPAAPQTASAHDARDAENHLTEPEGPQ